MSISLPALALVLSMLLALADPARAQTATPIEANRRLGPLSARSRDHLPNPVPDAADPYLPANRSAIGDLMSLFRF